MSADTKGPIPKPDGTEAAMHHLLTELAEAVAAKEAAEKRAVDTVRDRDEARGDATGARRANAVLLDELAASQALARTRGLTLESTASEIEVMAETIDNTLRESPHFNLSTMRDMLRAHVKAMRAALAESGEAMAPQEEKV